jgi:[histone H3]-trimethyl-L-lysine9/36 demethylase
MIFTCSQVIPPKGYIARRQGYDDVDLIIPAPVKQVLNGSKGIYQLFNIQQKPITVKEFEKIANSEM